MRHIPVLLDEVVEALNPKPGGRYIDCTLGDGGHTRTILEKSSPDGQILGLDQDMQQIQVARTKLGAYVSRATLVCARFSALERVAQEYAFSAVDGILFDLGYSSSQLADARYGLDYLKDDTPLDMRLSLECQQSAADFLNRADEGALADVLYMYGDRHNSRTLARKIVMYRRKKTFQVVRDLKDALDLWKPAFLAPIFQALRIWVNDEFGEIKTALPAAVSLLKPGGVLAVISFHSGEDRLVKQFLQSHRELLEVSSRKVRPSYQEIRSNPRARSALLRTAQKK